LSRIDPTQPHVQALIMAPTRELANQIKDVTNALGDFMNTRALACVGGNSIREDVESLKHGGIQVITGTPGRILDLVQRGILDTSGIRMLILDEADEMLSLGFKDQIYDIFQLLPERMQVGLFSATMPNEALELAKKFMNDPIRILVEQDEVTLSGIRQFYINCDREQWKLDVLSDLYDTLNIAQTVIFVNTRKKVDWLSNELRAKDFTVSSMHGDLEQAERKKIMANFKEGASRILITTDLVGRGIDVHGVSMVVNYDLPKKFESYIHRIGRSGRFGRKGVAVNLVTKEDMTTLQQIEKFYSTSVAEMPENIAEYL